MSDISISKSNTDHLVSELISKIQSEIIQAAEGSGRRVISAVEHSSGDFTDALKEEMEIEAAVMKMAGGLLSSMAEYIRSASEAFAGVDTTYQNSKVR